MFTTATFIVNFGKTISRHQNLTGFRRESAEDDYMYSVQCMDCFVIYMEGMKREKTTRKRVINIEDAWNGNSPAP
jgi:hypothetical protein